MPFLRRLSRHLNDRRFWLIQGLVVTLVIADVLLGAEGGEELEFAPIVLLAVPVVYAALSFGWEGGFFTGVWSATLVLSDLGLWYAGVVGRTEAISWTPDAVGAVMLVALGAFVGWRVQRELALQDEVREFANKLEVAQAVRRSEDYFELLMQHMTDLVAVMTVDGTMKYDGPSTEQVLGYEQGELIGKNVLELVHPDDFPAVAASWAECVRTPGVAPAVQFRLRHKDGSWRAIEAIRNNCLHDPKVAGITVTARDVTRRRETEEKLERVRSEFFGMVSHELRTPITVIKGLAEVEAHRDFDVQEARESFATILQSADGLQQLAESVLDISKIEAGAFSVDPEPVSVRAVVREARDVFYRSRRFRDVDMRLDNDMPVIEADRRRIVQVLLNLLDNAAKFSQPPEPIVLEAEQDHSAVTFRVRDCGRGIAPEKLPLLFQKFSRVHDDGGKLSGSGLGLAICKGIIEAHGGRIWAESSGEGTGSTFSFTLPIAER